MRAYFFGNMYLSDKQQGIQAQHVTTRLFTKYRLHLEVYKETFEMLFDWAENHETTILLNGGMADDLTELHNFFEQAYCNKDNFFPYSYFRESKEALGQCMTSVGIILPPSIYNGVKAMQKVKRMRRDDKERFAFEIHNTLTLTDPDGNQEDVMYNEFEIELMERLGKYRLA